MSNISESSNNTDRTVRLLVREGKLPKDLKKIVEQVCQEKYDKNFHIGKNRDQLSIIERDIILRENIPDHIKDSVTYWSYGSTAIIPGQDKWISQRKSS